MYAPKPTDAHRRLEALVGDWEGDEHLPPSPWSKESRSARGAFSMRMSLGGLFLLSDYEESMEGEVFFRGHGVYGWDARKERYTMHWFDTMGVPPRETLGIWEGQELVFSSSGQMGHSRYVYTVFEADRIGFRIESSRDGEPWSLMMRGEYTRRALA